MSDDKQKAEIMEEVIKFATVFILGVAFVAGFAAMLLGDPYYLAEISPLVIVGGAMAWFTKRLRIW